LKVSDWLSAAAGTTTDAPALIAQGVTLDYGELDRRAEGLSAKLASEGVNAGDVVATTLPTGPELVSLVHATLRSGAALAPIDPELPERTREERVIELERALCVIHTSGTTGEPQPVELTCANHLWSAIGCGMRIGLDRTDRWLCCLPMHHIGGFA
jgi:O-succinylbenzoic acid--CoA ligase